MNTPVSVEEKPSPPGGSRLDFPVFQQLRGCPVTAAVIVVCVVICLLINYAPDPWRIVIRQLLVPNVFAIWSGAVWGLLTAAFVHIAFWHILFNLWWARDFGRLLEPDLGHLRYAGFIAAAAITSSGWQLLSSGSTGIGYSGVVYALFGYTLARRRSHPAYQAFLTRSTIAWLLVWLVLCVVLTALHVMSIGNEAHIAGLALGYLVGLAVERPHLRRVAIAGLVILLSGVVSAAAYMPWSPAWRVRREGAELVAWHRQAERGDRRAQYRLGAALAREPQQRDQGLQWLRKAAQAGDSEAMNALAWWLATAPQSALRDGREAVRWAEKAHQATGGAQTADTLAAAYAEAGRWDDAIALQQQAIAALPADSPHQRGYGDRLQLYTRHQPWREPQ
jgi:membrane associated rhomboid family serine protease